ncbi:MAG: hypothetical protein HKN28_13815 [Alphaproteobacteria bacterium]|nr:hypothetical protein [Alphaproteobacteria bacterium]
MMGHLGAGKSVLAQRLPGLLPPLSPGEALVGGGQRPPIYSDLHYLI